MQAILIKIVNRKESKAGKECEIEEDISLARAAGYEVSEALILRPKRYPLGKGKIEELSKRDEESVIFLNELTSSQKFRLQKALKKEVIDFYELVLKVFEEHAFSREAKLQIELARTRKRMPYIKKEIGVRVKEEHPGFSGGGEYIIRSHISNIRKRISKLQKELELYEKRKDIERQKRRNIISLAGYTNSGKSTLFNSLTRSSQKANDEPFTTLQTKSRALYLYEKRFIINDTIGFIRNLPSELIVPFRVTLRDIVDSDIILIIVDISEKIEEIEKKIEICTSTLRDIGVNKEKTKVIAVFNKIDKIEEERVYEIMDSLSITMPYVPISAMDGKNLGTLKDMVTSLLLQG
jgi:GTP-binding protein HflX